MNNTDVSFFFLLLGRFLGLRNYCWKVLLTLLKSRVPFHRCLIFKVQLSCLFRNSSPILSHYSPSCQGLSLTFLKFFRDKSGSFPCPLSETVSLFYHLSFPLSTLFLPFFDLFFAFVHSPGCVCGIGSFKVLYVVLHRKSYTIFLYHGINMSAVFR